MQPPDTSLMRATSGVWPSRSSSTRAVSFRRVPAGAGAERAPLAWVVLYPLGLTLLSLVAARAIWHLYEKHFLRLEAFFPCQSTRSAPWAVSRRREPAGVTDS
jgi:hypothetical protein